MKRASPRLPTITSSFSHRPDSKRSAPGASSGYTGRLAYGTRVLLLPEVSCLSSVVPPEHVSSVHIAWECWHPRTGTKQVCLGKELLRGCSHKAPDFAVRREASE